MYNYCVMVYFSKLLINLRDKFLECSCIFIICFTLINKLLYLELLKHRFKWFYEMMESHY
jgi:hypothetical protein